MKRKQLSLAKPCEKATLSSSKRFKRTVSKEEVQKASKGCTPANTVRSTEWALQAFQDWADQRNKRCKEECPRELLDKPYSPEEVCDCLQRFVAEARRGDGTPYLARTLYWILCGLLRHAREVQPNLPNFLARKDVHFNPPTLVCCINAHYS